MISRPSLKYAEGTIRFDFCLVMARFGLLQTLHTQLEWPKRWPMTWAYKIVNKQSGFFVPIGYLLYGNKYRCTVNGFDHGVEIQDYTNYSLLTISRAGETLYRILADDRATMRISEIRVKNGAEQLVCQGGIIRYKNPRIKAKVSVESFGLVGEYYHGVRSYYLRAADIPELVRICREYSRYG